MQIGKVLVLVALVVAMDTACAAEGTKVDKDVASPTPTQIRDFENSICKAIDANWKWPADYVLAGELGPSVINFVYFNGKVSHLRVIVSSGSTKIDQSFVHAMMNAHMPSPPAWLQSHQLAFRASLYTGLGDKDGICSRSTIELRQ